MSVLLRDVIDIPERADSNDYVLRLTDSTDDDAHIRATLDDYVLTDSLISNFESAIELVGNALSKSTSRAAYLVGSFGSGKSHFMAVLYALLGNHPAIRTPAFQPLTGRYDGTIAGKKVLRLTYHLLGAKSLEQAVFQGYIEQIRRLHPTAPLPALHISDSLLADAEKLRATMGDDQFVAGLGGGADDDDWGGLVDSAWDLGRYQEALNAPAEDPLRRELISVLVSSYFGSFVETATYIDLDRGLVVLSEHARDLGYDAVVLFLDELMLWLGFAVRDAAFFSRESSKLTKLVESSGRSRAIPLVSFISRQMDLRKWFADSGASGAEQEAFDRNVEYQQGRFREIELGDDNLAEVAQKRLLRPRDEASAAVLDEAFANLTRSSDVWDVLRDSVNATDRHKGASEKDFRMTYPFSPVLVSTLRNLSSVMQRERTALKVMQKMLVDRRDTITVDDLIPVGDSFEYIVEGGDPIDLHAANMFRAAADLYRTKLLPALMAKHSVTAEQLDTDPSSVPTGFRGQDRIAKTLLLAAIAPKVPALQDVDSARLAALNHGSIKARLAGGESRVVLGVVREWSQKDVPEISLTGTENPVIRVQLTDVDYQSVLDRIRGEDRPGQRRQLLRKLIHEALGVRGDQDNLLGAATRTIVWRGSRREVDIVFGNVRDSASLPDSSFDNRTGTWRVIIDYPFDETGYSSNDDVKRIDGLVSRGIKRQTIVWLPRFFSERALDDFALLVKLDWLFTGADTRWTENSDHLSAGDRAQAQGILNNLYSGTLTAFTSLLRQAYGIDPHDDTMFIDDASPSDILTSLSPDFTPAMPPAADLEDALVKIADQAYSAVYPSHPAFDPTGDEVTARQLETVRDYVEQASSHREGRVPTLPGTDRKAVRRIAGPLRVGQATEDHYLFGEQTFAYWAQELDRAANAAGDPLTVGTLQAHVDSMSPAWGLRPETRDLVISAWVLLRKRSWFEAGTAVPAPKLGQLRPHIELRAEDLPEQDKWDAARAVATRLLGYTSARTFLTGANTADFAAQVRKQAATKFEGIGQLEQQLARGYAESGCDASDGDRLIAVRGLRGFADQLNAQAGAVELINQLAAFQIGIPIETAGRILSEASRDSAALSSFQYDLLIPLRTALRESEPRDDEAHSIASALVNAVSITGRSLADELKRVEKRLVRWLVGPRDTKSGSEKVRSDADVEKVAEVLRELLQNKTKNINVTWKYE